MIGRMLEKIGGTILSLSQATGEMLKLLWQTIFYFKEAPRNLPAIFKQMSDIGIDTLPIAALLAFFVGMVLALQTGTQLALYGTQNVIGAIVGLSMVKELGPVMTSMLVAGRVGSSMAAEIGAMKVYEEIDALKTLEINPVRYLAMPRMIACLLAVPAITVFSIIIGILGGGLISSVTPVINVPFSVYFDNMVQTLSYIEIFKGLLKAFVFGGIIAHVGCYVGFQTTGGARGIGRATTRAVVMAFLLIMVADYFLTRITL
nr:ABC transporter permease [Geoalkalibacter subterraneus]